MTKPSLGRACTLTYARMAFWKRGPGSLIAATGLLDLASSQHGGWLVCELIVPALLLALISALSRIRRACTVLACHWLDSCAVALVTTGTAEDVTTNFPSNAPDDRRSGGCCSQPPPASAMLRLIAATLRKAATCNRFKY